jgi:hypothetical protein
VAPLALEAFERRRRRAELPLGRRAQVRLAAGSQLLGAQPPAASQVWCSRRQYGSSS